MPADVQKRKKKKKLSPDALISAKQQVCQEKSLADAAIPADNNKAVGKADAACIDEASRLRRLRKKCSLSISERETLLRKIGERDMEKLQEMKKKVRFNTTWMIKTI